MKKLLLSTVCAATLSFNAYAALNQSSNFKFVGDTEYAQLCQAAATKDLDLFKSNVKQHSFRMNLSESKMIALLAGKDSVQCSGQRLLEFSEARGSHNIANYLTGAKSVAKASSTEKYKFVGDKSYKNFCKSAVTNNVGLFKRALIGQIGRLGVTKHEVMDKVLNADNVTCAGENLADFFQSREATEVMSYIKQNSVK